MWCVKPARDANGVTVAKSLGRVNHLFVAGGPGLSGSGLLRQ